LLIANAATNDDGSKLDAEAGNPETEVTMHTTRVAAALSLVGAISLASLPVQAAPLTSLSAAAKPAAQSSDAIQQVRWGGWHGGWHGGGLAFGIGALAAGALIGAAIASPSYYGGYPYYGGYSYYGGSPYYGYGYGSPYRWGYSTTYYPSYSYSYYRPYRPYAFGYHRPYRHFAYGYRYHRPYRHFHVAHRPVWRHSFAMVGVRHHRHHWH